MTCVVCVEDYGKFVMINGKKKKTGNRVDCSNEECDFEACTKCVGKYLLESNKDPHCMHCDTHWSNNFMKKTFTKNFMKNDYKKHRENVLFEREQALMPSTTTIVEHENKIKKLEEERKKRVEKFELELRELDSEIRVLSISSKKKRRERPNFIRKCMIEDCEGFISSNWKCNICEVHYCPECHIEIGKKFQNDQGEEVLPEHECKDDDKSTAQLLSRDTKPCPQCKEGIYKISGCSQMFCTLCNVAFDWTTGRVLNGSIHNPHYFEAIRNGNIDVNMLNNRPGCIDGNIRRHLSPYTLNNNFKRLKVIYGNLIQNPENFLMQYSDYDRFLRPKSVSGTDKFICFNSMCQMFFECLRIANHLTDVEIRDLNSRYYLQQNSNENNTIFDLNLDIRKKLINKEFTKDRAKSLMVLRENNRLKAINKKNILETISNVFYDLLNDLNVYLQLNNISDFNKLKRFFDHFEIILQFFKDRNEDILNAYYNDRITMTYYYLGKKNVTLRRDIQNGRYSNTTSEVISVKWKSLLMKDIKDFDTSKYKINFDLESFRVIDHLE